MAGNGNVEPLKHEIKSALTLDIGSVVMTGSCLYLYAAIPDDDDLSARMHNTLYCNVR